MIVPTPLRFVASRRNARAGSARLPGQGRARTVTAALVMAFAILAVVATPATDDVASTVTRGTVHQVSSGLAAHDHHIPPARAAVIGSLQQPIEVAVSSLNAAGTVRFHTGGRWFLLGLIALAIFLAGIPRNPEQRWARVHAWTPAATQSSRANPTRGPPIR